MSGIGVLLYLPTKDQIMNKLLALLVLLPSVALAGPPDTFTRRSVSETQNLTRAVPTLATEGTSITNGISFSIEIDLGVGRTFTGGLIDVYLYDKWDGVNFSWSKFPSRSSLPVTQCSGLRRCVIESFSIDGPRLALRAIAVANGVTASSGTTVIVNMVTTVSGNSLSK